MQSCSEVCGGTSLIDTERRITITADHGKELCMFGFSNECVAKEDWDDFLRDLARFHHASSKVMEELEGAGLKVYRAEWMEENLDALLEHEELKFYACQSTAWCAKSC